MLSGEATVPAVRLSPLAAFHLAVAFLTRLPLPQPKITHPGALAASMHLFPLAGLVIGGIGALVYLLAGSVLPAPLAAVLAVAATILTTGGLHEDGLADCADGFGGGTDPERKLAIMKDSRIGSYGMLATSLGLLLRIGALASLASLGTVVCALLTAHALARACLPVAMQMMVPVRPKGLGASIGRPSASTAGIAATLGLVIAGLLLPAGSAVAAILMVTLATLGMVWLAWRQIGGFTGDVLGAIEQVAETVTLLAVVACL